MISTRNGDQRAAVVRHVGSGRLA